MQRLDGSRNWTDDLAAENGLTRDQLFIRAAALGLAVPSLGALFGSATSLAAVAGGTATYADHEVPYDSLDLHKSGSAGTAKFLEPIYDRLVWAPRGTRLYPGLASSWKVSQDATEFTFSLRKDVQFHDGTKFDANAVKFTFDRIAHPATKAVLSASALGPYDSSEIIDDFTVKVKFKKSNGPFMIQLGTIWLGIISPTAVKQYGDKFVEHPTGTGPFRLKEFATDRLVLEPNSAYRWGPTLFANRRAPLLDGLVVRAIAEDSTRVATLQTNESQMIEQVPEPDRVRLEKDSKYKILRIGSAGMPQFVFVNRKAPPTNDLRVRRAIAYGVDVASIIQKVYLGNRSIAKSLLETSMLGYDANPKNGYSYNPTRAEALLDQAGWTRKGKSGIRQRAGRKLTVILTVTPGFEIQKFAPLMQAQLRNIGVDVKLLTLDAGATVATWNKGSFNLASGSFKFADSSLLATWFRTAKVGTTANWARYSNRTVDALIDRGAATVDSKKRAVAYKQAVEMLLRDVAAFPLFHQRNVYAATANLKAVKFSVEGYPRWQDATL